MMRAGDAGGAPDASAFLLGAACRRAEAATAIVEGTRCAEHHPGRRRQRDHAEGVGDHLCRKRVPRLGVRTRGPRAGQGESGATRSGHRRRLAAPDRRLCPVQHHQADLPRLARAHALVAPQPLRSHQGRPGRRPLGQALRHPGLARQGPGARRGRPEAPGGRPQAGGPSGAAAVAYGDHDRGGLAADGAPRADGRATRGVPVRSAAGRATRGVPVRSAAGRAASGDP